MALGLSNSKWLIWNIYSAYAWFYPLVDIFIFFNHTLFFPFYWKIFSRTLHISWDDAGCLCPVGDLFNYAAPDEESCSDDLNSSPGALQLNDVTSLKCIGTIEQPDVEQLECYSRRLTDGGYEEDTASYCFYAREIYKKGEQVTFNIF